MESAFSAEDPIDEFNPGFSRHEVSVAAQAVELGNGASHTFFARMRV
jgi:hypothetical protein